MQPEKGKPLERVGRKATGLRPAHTGYGCRAAGLRSTSRGLYSHNILQRRYVDMRRKGLFLWTVTLASFLISFSLLSQPHLAQASCGCLKPPPEPATVIPNIAVPGLPITLFHDSFQAGQKWKVVFESRTAGKLMRQMGRTVIARVIQRRDITDPTGATYTPQLVVRIPSLPNGPTGITVSRSKDSFHVSEESLDRKSVV